MRGCACGDREGVSSPELGVAHVSCLARQAKILVAEGEANNAHADGWDQWDACSLCGQRYHGVVRCALGWACWKTYLGLPEKAPARRGAMMVLGSGLCAAKHHEDALSVQEAELAMERRLGAPEDAIRVTQGNLANTYQMVGQG